MIGQAQPDVQVEKKILEPGDDDVKHSIANSRGRRRTLDTQLSSAVLEGKIDLAIYNMNDLPLLKRDSMHLIAATPERSSPYEALVSLHGQALPSLKPARIVGTSPL